MMVIVVLNPGLAMVFVILSIILPHVAILMEVIAVQTRILWEMEYVILTTSMPDVIMIKEIAVMNH